MPIENISFSQKQERLFDKIQGVIVESQYSQRHHQH